MFNALLSKIVGTKNERELKRIQPLVGKINVYEPWAKNLTDAQMQEQTDKFKARLEKGETLEELLPEAFALVREAGRRTLKMRHFDVQLIGGIVLHEGKIAEMKTGEGKTLVATLPAYLNALTGKGVHIITVNDYLAKRDSQWMGGIYRALGLTVGLIQHDMGDLTRQKAYGADITFGTNNEYGFDYLRDNMKFSREQLVQRELNYAIVDEVDSILIDEARTPLIISGPTDETTDKYYLANDIIPKVLKNETNFQLDEKARTVSLSETGVTAAERLLGKRNLYDPKNIEWVHHVNQALKAHVLFKKDVDYVVKDGEVIIVDEFTGRLMPGRRYSEGLHQALEAKERVKIERENQTLASITFQNYFRMYKKLAGMTGTADTEAPEFAQIYNLDVMVIPTNRDLIRHTFPDAVYRTEKEKFHSAVEEIAEGYKKGQPALVGTISIDKSERLSKLLKLKGVPHEVLNAKYHEREAEIVAQAGRLKAVTIATNMAGRGTDILLGGNSEFLARDYLKKQGMEPENVSEEAYRELLAQMEDITQQEHDQVVALGGLHIIGTERHESRRIDNQLRGRAGRQGDPGSSRFYLSLEDDLMRIFGSDRLSNIMGRIGVEENQPIEHNLVSRAIETAQKRVETHNFDIRKHLLEYDDVMNKQRQVIYEQRRKVLDGEEIKEYNLELAEEALEGLIDIYAAEGVHPEDWDVKGLNEGLQRQFGIELSQQAVDECGDREDLFDHLKEQVYKTYEEREAYIGPQRMRELERHILLYVIDNHWKDHLLSMDHLKEGIGLRGYGQKDPLLEYKKEGFDMFSAMVEHIKEEAVGLLFKVQFETEEAEAAPPPPRREPVRVANPSAKAGAADEEHRQDRKIGRNDPCPCGSGKKYKKCCGR